MGNDEQDDTKGVDEYLAGVPNEARPALEKLRATIRKAAPTATEGFSYGMPAFRLHGRPLVAYGAMKKHCSFFPMSSELIETHRKEIEPYETSKGTIRFTPDQPLPAALVRKLVQARIAQVERRA
jgi:uncharacterized protein YdhG (YjbR/CyaY superfamily)